MFVFEQLGLSVNVFIGVKGRWCHIFAFTHFIPDFQTSQFSLKEIVVKKVSLYSKQNMIAQTHVYIPWFWSLRDYPSDTAANPYNFTLFTCPYIV